MAKYLDETGLGTLWGRIDNYFLRKSGGNITGSLTISDNAVLHAGNYNSSTYADTVPTLNSTKLITSGGMYSVIEEIEDVVAASENSLNTRISTLEGMNLVLGTGLTTDKIVLGNGAGNVKTSSKGISTSAPNPSSDDTTIPTSKAVWDALGSMSGALKYKGTIASSGGTVTDLPAIHSVGDVYVVKTAGTYAGKACEVGDYIICNRDGTSADNSHWDVLNGENQVENKSASLAAAGSSATIATIDGTDITVTTPSGWTGLDKVGTITKVGNTTSGDVAVSVTSGGATIGTTATTIATIGGVAVQAKIDSYAAPDHNNHYIGTTQVQNSSAQQDLAGIGASTFNGVMNLTGSSTSYCQGIRIHDVSSTSSIWFRAQAASGFDAGMVGISGNSSGLVFRLPATASGTTPNAYLTIAYGGEIATTNITTATTASGKNMAFKEVRTGGASVSMGVGTGNVNHGVYSHSLSKWLIRGDSTDTTDKKVYVNETFVPNNSGTVLTTSNYSSTLNSVYVRTNPGAAEQTIQSGISTYAKGVVEFYRSSGDHICFVSFANKDSGGNKVTLGAIGFRNSSYSGPYYKDGSNYYALYHEGNLNTTTFPGLDKTGTITQVGNTTSGAVTVSSADATIGTTDTTIATIGGVEIKAKIGTYLTSSSTLDATKLSGTIPASCYTQPTVNDKNIKISDGTNTKTVATGNASADKTLTISASQNITAVVGGSDGAATLTLTGPNLSSYLTSSSTLDATKLSGTIPSSCYTDTDTDIRFADYFGESTTGASTVKKTTTNNSKTLASGDLVTGLSAIIYHQYANSGASATLNVGGSGDKAMYNAAGTRISGSTGTWTAKDIIRWVYDSSLNSGSGGWKISAILGNGDSHRLRVLTGRTPLYSYTETDPVYSASAASGISSTDISNWNTAYGWGDPSGTYLPLAGGQMTGAINTAPSTSANDTGKGLNFTGSNSATGHIGMSTLLGIYSSGNIVLRPNGGSSSGAGLELTGTSIVFNGKAVLTSDRDVRFADFFGESETAVGTAAKTTATTYNSRTLTSADLVSGFTAIIYHKYSNSNSAPTLNVGGAGGKKMYTTGGTRITASNVWAAGDIVRWVYDATLDSNSGGWVKADVIANGESHRYRLLTGGTTIPAAITDSTVQGWGYTKGIKIATRSNTTTDTLQDTSGNDITYSPSSGITSINAVPLYRQDADWGDWVFCWERNNGYGKAGIMYKSGSSTDSYTGELGVAGITHFYSTVTMAASNSYTPGTVNTGRMAVAFQGTAASTPGTDGCSFYIQCKAYDSTDSWKNFAIFRFNENGIYKYFDANCPNSNYAGQAYWVLDESMALSNSEIDSILAAAASS